jgi:pilus assembly protein CpaB
VNNKRRIIGILAALVLAVVGTISLIGYVNSAKDDAVAKEELVDVYVVDEFIPKGADPATIKAAVSIEKVPSRLKQEGAITDLKGVGQLVATEDLQVGDQLVVARLAPREQVAAIVKDKVQVSALLEAERAVGGSLEKGDLVGVYLSFEPFDSTVQEASVTFDDEFEFTEGTPEETGGEIVNAIESPAPGGDESDPADATVDEEILEGATVEFGDATVTEKTPNTSRLEFRHVLVTNVQTINPPVRPADEENDDTEIAQVTGTQYVVTLALSAEQSERFVFATEFGNVWLSIDPATVKDDGTRVVTLDEVYEVVKP